jgi:type I restriction enzyme R subunit
MTRLTESAIEAFAIKLFEQLGYTYVYAPDKVNGEARGGALGHGDRPERSRYDEVILNERLKHRSTAHQSNRSSSRLARSC